MRFTEEKSGVAVILPTVNEVGTIKNLTERILSLGERIHIYVLTTDQLTGSYP